jgi:hypothetical protein
MWLLYGERYEKKSYKNVGSRSDIHNFLGINVLFQPVEQILYVLVLLGGQEVLIFIKMVIQANLRPKMQT